MVCVKLLFTTLCFVGLYSMPNLIVMLFNLLYPICIVGFYCKGCVLERESVKTQATKDWRDFAGSSWLSIPWKEAYASHMTRMRRVKPDGDSCVSRVSRGKALPAGVSWDTVVSFWPDSSHSSHVQGTCFLSRDA